MKHKLSQMTTMKSNRRQVSGKVDSKTKLAHKLWFSSQTFRGQMEKTTDCFAQVDSSSLKVAAHGGSSICDSNYNLE